MVCLVVRIKNKFMRKILNKTNKKSFYLLLLCLVISFFLNRSCVPDEFCDPDPVYGGCHDICSYDNFSFLKFFANTFGLFVFGSLSGAILNKEHKEEISL